MNTRLVVLDSDAAHRSSALREAAAVLQADGLVAFPTETVYGLGANALSPVAVSKIYEAKGRPSTNPLIVHVLSVEDAKKLASAWPESAQALADAFWPGPLTVIVPKASTVPDTVTGGGATVAIRIPTHPVARALLEQTHFPIAAPSANASNTLSATTAAHVQKSLGGKIEMILDGGAASGGLESTVVDCTTDPVTIRRPGLLSRDAIQAVLPVMIDGDSVATAGEPLASPGMLARHYAPRVPLKVVDSHTLTQPLDPRTGALLCGNRLPAEQERSIERLPADPVSYAAGLYAALHRLEEQDIDLILVEMPPQGDAWTAIHDRLKRAGTPA